MLQERDGAWRATLDLPANNDYAFRYMIDGNWQTDNRADGFAQTIKGDHSSLVQT